MAYATDGKVGLDLAASAASSRSQAPGLIVNASDGSRWMYVTNVNAISQFDCVAIQNGGTATPITPALAITGALPGFAQVAFAASQNGWVALSGGGGLKVNTDASCLPSVPLYTSDTAGTLSDSTASASHHMVLGVILLATQSVAGATAASITYPLVRRPVA